MRVGVFRFGDPCTITSVILFTLRDVLCTYADKKKKGESVLTTLAIANVWMKYKHGASVQIYWQCRTRVAKVKALALPLWLPQIPHILVQIQTQISELRDRRLTSWSIVWVIKKGALITSWVKHVWHGLLKLCRSNKSERFGEIHQRLKGDGCGTS